MSKINNQINIKFWNCHGIECFSFMGFHSCDLRNRIGSRGLWNCIKAGCDFYQNSGTVRNMATFSAPNSLFLILIEETVE